MINITTTAVRPIATTVCTGLALLATCICPSTAVADVRSWLQQKHHVSLMKWDTWKGDDTPQFARGVIRTLFEEYEREHGTATIGRAMIGGDRLSNLADGTSTTLTFAFVNAATGEPVDVPELAGVRYKIQTDPPTEDPFQQVLQVLGTSTDAPSGFAFPYVISGFEPLIIGIPLDASGDPIVMRGARGVDVSGGVATNIFCPGGFWPALWAAWPSWLSWLPWPPWPWGMVTSLLLLGVSAALLWRGWVQRRRTRRGTP